MSDEKRIVFMDLETTGLNPEQDQILELAFIVTDEDLNVTYAKSCLVVPRQLPVTAVLDRNVFDMHTASGLLAELNSAWTRNSLARVETVELEVLRDLALLGFKPQTVQLAGFSIQFDRSFIAQHMPDLHRYLSHRMLDVSTLRQLAKRWRPEIVKEQGKAHRAMLDCREALAELQHYREQLFGMTSPAFDLSEPTL